MTVNMNRECVRKTSFEDAAQRTSRTRQGSRPLAKQGMRGALGARTSFDGKIFIFS